jgi:hypothetical protein
MNEHQGQCSRQNRIWEACVLQLAYISAVTCRTDAVSGPGRRRIPLSPDSLPSPATPSKAATTPQRYEERENFLKSFSYEWLPSLSAGMQGKKRGGDFENCINQVSIHYTPSDSLRSAKCSWVRSYVTLHCRTSNQLQDSHQLILSTCRQVSVQISCTHSTTDRRDLHQQYTFNYRQLGYTASRSGRWQARFNILKPSGSFTYDQV